MHSEGVVMHPWDFLHGLLEGARHARAGYTGDVPDLEVPDSPATYIERRHRLAAALAGRPAVVFAGGLRARNYLANTYPYRADSHFVYLVGTPLADAVLVVESGQSELFVPRPPADDALWHGAQASAQQLQASTGVARVRPLDELPAVLEALRKAAPSELSTLPSADPLTRAKQARLLGRMWSYESTPDPAQLDEPDLVLARAIVELRLVHDASALEMMRHASSVTERAHRAGMSSTRPGRHEREIRAAMEHELHAHGCSTAYGSIVTVHGEVLHNTDAKHTLAATDMVLADLGAEWQGWAGDVTRTWPVSGTFSPTQRALYELVLAAQTEACAMVRPGVRYREIHLRAATVLTRGLVDEGILRGDPETLVERGAHALLFPHGVGHLLGLDVHDMEDLGDLAGYAPGRTRSSQFGLSFLRLDRDLQPGMVVTIEPGLYQVPAILEGELAAPFVADGTLRLDALRKFADVRGIRIEDDVCCTDGAPHILSEPIPKTVAEVEAAVGAGA